MKNKIEKELFSRDFKLQFLGYGDWLDEPDQIQFEYKGFLCLIDRIIIKEPYALVEAYFGGHLCGYIFLPSDHPLYGKNFDEIDLDCWRGITHAEESTHGWKIGFDCAHSSDIVPSMLKLRTDGILQHIYDTQKEFIESPLFSPTYKNVSFCIKQCKSLATQAYRMIPRMFQPKSVNPIQQ